MRTSLFFPIGFLFFSALAVQAAATAVDPAFVGTWSGSATIVVNWTKQRSLPVDLTIASDGGVVGRVGDAVIVDGEFRRNRGALGRALKMGTDYIITGDLRGAVIASEGIDRGSFTMPLNWRDGAFAGGVHAGRSKVGGREHMMLSATRMRLTRKPDPQQEPGQPAPPRAIDSYRIDVTLDPSERRLEGEMHLRYRNTSSTPLGRVGLRLDPNLSAKQSLEIVQVEDEDGGDRVTS